MNKERDSYKKNNNNFNIPIENELFIIFHDESKPKR